MNHVDLVEKAILNETIAALQLEEWRSDLNDEIESINRLLPNAFAGDTDGCTSDEYFGEKALFIREWVTRVLDKIVRYKSEHGHLLNDAASTLQLVLPNDIVSNSVLPFLYLPSYQFDGEQLHEEE